jgi:hypothetical protein
VGYDLHITRKNSWADSEGPEISLAEWLAFVRADPEMQLDNYAETRLENGDVAGIGWRGFSVWTGWSQHGQHDGRAWFLYRDGDISVKNPDEEMCRKMWSIAQALSAKVQGDDHEVYDASANVSYPEEIWGKKPWWRFW